MPQWTDSARSTLENYFTQTRQSLKGSGADVTEVIEDLRRHVDAELTSRNLGVITDQDVRTILARLGTPEKFEAPEDPDRKAREEPPNKAPLRSAPGWLLFIFGIFLPFGTVVFEFLTGSCAGVFFDPLPSFLHTLLTLAVSVISFAIFSALRRDRVTNLRALAWANALAIGISAVYAVIFLPMTPIACVGILFFGAGLVALAPMFSFIAALRLRWHLNKLPEAAPALSRTWLGIPGGIVLLLLASAPMVLTEIGLQWAVDDLTSKSDRGIRILRSWGEEERMLRACYGRAGRAGGLYSWGKYIDPESARGIYYRVRGRAFNSVPPPKLYAGAMRWTLLEQEFTWDGDQGGDAVAGRVKGLNAVASRQDAIVDPAAAHAYVEWTLEFRNDSALDREARAQIQLPPGGVVSRLTLWVDGEEREAAFAGRAQVKAAYKEVVMQRRDPVLVTTCGPDRVLVQCFPVPRNGGRMKTRIGFTVPLSLLDLETAGFRLPVFVERNFSLKEDFSHSIWVESPGEFLERGDKLVSERTRSGGFLLRGQLKEQDLAESHGSVRVKRPGNILDSWAADSRQEGKAVKQRIELVQSVRPSRVILVADTSASLEACKQSILDAIPALPPGIEFNVVFARDGARSLWNDTRTLDAESLASVIRNMRAMETRGGHDNLPALLRAWDLAATSTNALILWVHGPLPVILSSPEVLRQRLERSASGVQIIDFQVAPGPNRVAEQLDGVSDFSSALRLGDVASDLKRLIGAWNSDQPRFKVVREQVNRTEVAGGHETSFHLVRLWAAEEAGRSIRWGRKDSAATLAAKYQLVTPVSGAVVLETQAQYDRAGLQPVAADTVPSIPEPSATVLFLLGLLFVLLAKSGRIPVLRRGSAR